MGPRTRLGLSRLARSVAGLASVLVVSGCGDAGDADASVAVDSSLVEVMVDLHLADAREQVSGDPLLGDSLRDLVYALHSLDSTQLRHRLDALADEPGAIGALTEAVEARLSSEPFGSPPP